MLRFFKKLEQSIENFRYLYVAFVVVVFCYVSLSSGDANYYRRVMNKVNEQNADIAGSYEKLAVAISNINLTMKIMNDQRQSDRVLYQRYFIDLMESDSIIHNKIDYYIDSKIDDLNRKSNQTDMKLDRLYYKIDSVHYFNKEWEDSLRRDRE